MNFTLQNAQVKQAIVGQKEIEKLQTLRDSLDLEHNVPNQLGKLKSPLADLTSYRGMHQGDSGVALGHTMGEGIFS
jgi:hypothetical protein